MRMPWQWRRQPKAAPGGEVAGTSVGEQLAPFIGELPLDPRYPARYAHANSDESQALLLYRETLRDERCMAALSQRLDAVVSRPWEVEPGGSKRQDRRAADDLTEQLEAVGFNTVCRQLLHGVWYGYAVAEAMWARDGDRIVLDRLPTRAPDRFRWSPQNELLLRTWSHPRGEPVPDAKFVVLARPGESSDLPHGLGLGRWCYWPVWFKRHGLKFWSVALERFGSPTAKGTHPPKASEEEKDRLLQLVRNLATGTGVVIPEGQDISLVESVRRAGGDFADFVKYQDQALTTTILGQSSTTDQGPWKGTAEVQKDVRDETIAADARLLDDALNATIARWLTSWNFPTAAIPRIRRDVDPPEDLDARARREEVIARVTGLRPTQAHVETVYGGEWEGAPPPQPGPPNPADPGDAAAQALLAAFASQRHGGAIDAAVESMLAGDGWEPLMEPIIEPVLAEASAALARGDSLEAFRDRSLPALFERMDDAELVQTLRRMGFSSRLSGDAGLSDDE